MKRKDEIKKMLGDLGKQHKNIRQYDLGWRVGYRFAIEQILK